MSDISKWFGKAIYITALDNFEEINKDIVPLINSEVVPTNSQYARTTDIKPNELQSIDDNIHHDERFKNLFDAIQPKIIEALEFASDSYWGDPERFLFRAAITSFPTPVLLENGSDRANRSELSLIVQGYIIPDTVNVAQAGPSPKSYNVTKTSFTEKVV